MTIARSLSPRGLFYGWTLVGVAAFVMVIGTVPLFQGMTAWFVVLESHFNWTRTQLSIAFSLSRVEGSIMGPISGYLIDRLGSRRMVLIGLIVAGGGFVIMSQMQNIWHFYIAFVVMSMGVGLGTWMPMMTVLNNWFVRNRSTAMALAMEGFLVGGMALVPLLAFVIDPDVPGRPGWRMTALAIGIFLMVMALPVSRLIRNAPEPYGLFPDGDPAARPRQTSTASGETAEEPDFTWQEAIQDGDFLAHNHGPRLLVHRNRDADGAPGADAGRPGIFFADHRVGCGRVYRSRRGVHAHRRVRRRPPPDTAGAVRVLRDPVGLGGGADAGGHPVDGLPVRGADGHRIRRSQPVDHRHPRGLLRAPRPLPALPGCP